MCLKFDLYKIIAYMCLQDNNLLLQIFVGGLDPSISEEYLRQVFGTYGQLEHVKIPVGKRCGFVQFAERYIAVVEHIY